MMAEGGNFYRSKFNFKGKNNDELCFRKNDVITVTQRPDGGWWEGTLGEKTGWFPSNYVVPIQEGERHLRGKSPMGGTRSELPLSPPASSSQKAVYRNVVLKDLIEAEKSHVKELEEMLSGIVKPLEGSKILGEKDISHVLGNFTDVAAQQKELLDALEQSFNSPDQRIGGLFLTLAPRLKTLLETYCRNHPLAIDVINRKRAEIIAYLEGEGIQFRSLIAGLSQPFRHIQKYPTTLQELERNMEESSPDKGDTQRAASVYRDITAMCADVRKQKEMQLELLNGLMEGWEGSSIQSMGDIICTGTITVSCGEEEGEEVERCVVLFPNSLIILTSSPNFTSYIFERKIDLIETTVRRLESQGDRDALVLESQHSGSVTLIFLTQEELNRWIKALKSAPGVTVDESCSTVTPTKPSKYRTVQGEVSPLMKPQISVMPAPDQAELLRKAGNAPGRLNHELQMIEPAGQNEPPLPAILQGDPRRSPPHSLPSKPLPPPQLWSKYSLMPHPAPRGNFVYDPQKNSIKMRKRGHQPSDHEDASVLKVVEAYCTSAMMKHNGHSDSPQLLVAEDEKIIIEEMIGDEIVMQEKSLVDTVYALKDQLDSVQKDLKCLMRIVEKEQRARKRLEEQYTEELVVARIPCTQFDEKTCVSPPKNENENIGEDWMLKQLRRALNNRVMDSLPVSAYPQARRCDHQDEYHGTKVADPYRWMEDPDAEETINYVNQLNNVSVPFLEGCTFRNEMRKRLTEMWDYPKYGCTSKHGEFYFYGYNPGLLNQSVFYIADSPEEEGKVFQDPNTYSDDGTTAVKFRVFTEDGSIMAYGLSEKGSDWTTLKFKNVPSGEDLPDVLSKLRYSGTAWTHDGKSVFYSMYPKHGAITEGHVTEKNEFHSLFWHKLGTDQSEDILCVDFPDNPEYMIDGEVSEDGRYLIVSVSRGCDPYNMLYFYDLEKVNNTITGKLNLTPIAGKLECKIEYIGNDGEDFILMTDMDAPMYKLVKANIHKPEKENWTCLIPENPDAKLDWACPVAGNKLVTCYLEDVKNVMYIHDLTTGKQLNKFPLDIGSVGGFFGRRKENEIFYSFSNDLNPGAIYRCALTDAALQEGPQPKLMRQIEIKGFDFDKFEMEQVFYSSKDGTKVPMFIIRPKDMKKDGKTPMILYGYGGFNIPLTPSFSISRLMFFQNLGGAYAIANLRGGSEYGERWHQGGMKEKKQNVFDDFIAAADYLIQENYTSPQKLISHGGSNGGLLVAACANQRPDLYAGVINRVGVMDMLRFHRFTIGQAWVPEFGSPDDPEEFKVIQKYSPLHNLQEPSEEGVQIPSMLMMTADHDDRVVPLHTLKYTAQLYHTVAHSSKQTNPLLTRVEVKAGHGHGKPTAKIIEELVDIYCYVARILNLDWKQ